MDARKLVLPVAVVLLLSISSAAVSIGNASSPSTVWEGTDAELAFDCSTDQPNESLTGAEIRFDNQSDIDSFDLSGDTGQVSISYTPEDFGEYSGKFYCKSNKTQPAKTSFSFTHTKLEIRNLSLDEADVYTDSKLGVQFTVFQIDDQETELTSDINATIEDIDWNESRLEYEITSQYTAWRLEGRGDLETGEEEYTLRVENGDGGVEKDFDLSVAEPFTAELDDVPDGVVAGKEFSVGLSVTYRDQQLDLDEVSVSPRVGGSTVSHGVGDDTLTITAPDDIDERPWLDVTVNYTDDGEVYEQELRTRLDRLYPVGLDVLDSIDPSGGLFRLEGDGVYGTWINGSSPLLTVPTGTYDMFLQDVAGSEEVTLSNLSVTGPRRQALRLDSPPVASTGLSGVEAFATLAMESGYEFDGTLFRMFYDPVAVRSEQAVELFHCADYNFDSQYCWGEWDTVDPTLDPVRNYVEKEVETLGAFVAGRRKQLQVSTRLQRDYRLNETMEVVGTVADTGGDPAANVSVNVWMAGMEHTAVTGPEGAFEMVFEGPSTAGVYDLTITASGGLYMDDTRTFDVEVRPERSFMVSLPEQVRVTRGGSTTVPVTVTNTGQIALTNIDTWSNTSCGGCSVSTSPGSIARLPMVGERRFNVSVSVPVDGNSSFVRVNVFGSTAAASSRASVEVVVEEPEGLFTGMSQSMTGLLNLGGMDRFTLAKMVRNFAVLAFMVIASALLYLNREQIEERFSQQFGWDIGRNGRGLDALRDRALDAVVFPGSEDETESLESFKRHVEGLGVEQTTSSTSEEDATEEPFGDQWEDGPADTGEEHGPGRSMVDEPVEAADTVEDTGEDDIDEGVDEADRSHVCDECGEGFETMLELYRHNERHH